MKTYDQNEKFIAYIALGSLGAATLLLCFLIDYLGMKILSISFLVITILFFAILFLLKAIRSEDKKPFCEKCGKYVNDWEVTISETHTKCGWPLIFKNK